MTSAIYMTGGGEGAGYFPSVVYFLGQKASHPRPMSSPSSHPSCQAEEVYVQLPSHGHGRGRPDSHILLHAPTFPEVCLSPDVHQCQNLSPKTTIWHPLSLYTFPFSGEAELRGLMKSIPAAKRCWPR